jgi:hypothetical protein
MPAPWTDVRVCSTAALAANEMEPGDIVDGVTLVAGDRILVAAPGGSPDNGIFVCSATPTRATDANQSAHFARHRAVKVTAGASNAGRTFRYIGKANPAPDTDSLLFAAAPVPKTL